MTWFQDLSPCTYMECSHPERVKAVGWLEPSHEYPQGKLDENILKKLKELAANPWEPDHFMGCHGCEFCNTGIKTPMKREDTGVYNLFIPGRGNLYIAPELIVHYIERHRYVPPDEFQRAVKACPAMGSEEYHREVKLNGPDNWGPDWMSLLRKAVEKRRHEGNAP